MSLENINKKHVLDAVAKIEAEAIELEPSTGYDVIINGMPYPPKEVMRYANQLANGTKEWPYSGGEPTNRFLRAMEFDIVSKGEDKEPSSTQEGLVGLIKRLGKENAQIYFDCAEQLIRALDIKEGDVRLTYGTRGDKRLALTIGQRYCLALVPGEDYPWQFIQESSGPSGDSVVVTAFDGEPEAYYYRCKSSADMASRMAGINRAAEKELHRTDVSGYRKHNSELFEKAILNAQFRKGLFEAAFGVQQPLTGVVWKLGCNWGEGAPNFYDAIHQRSVVICTDNRKYVPGDLVAVAVGFDVVALAKVLDQPKAVTDAPDLKEDFVKYKIDYEPWVKYAHAEWYVLSKEEAFNYPQRIGRCRLKDPYKHTALTTWNDRFISYWVFQCNPVEFDFETAVRKGLLHDWTVAAHKDKIKKGDKVILWLTGKRAGCYALARVTSDPGESATSPDGLLWKGQPKASLKAGIEITHNLLESPILWQNIKDQPDLKELKVGHQGTNFSATRKQYYALLKLISNNLPYMNSKIDLFVNTIFYGPPGTGKTYRLNEYKEEYFTDRGITKSSEDVLKEKVAAYPFWKVLGAVLGTSKKPLTVGEIIEHPIVKARVNPANKTKPNNLAWADLQSYADDASTQLVGKYRRSIKLFHKNEESQWSISEDKREELADIIDPELLQLAATPAQPPLHSTTSKTRYSFITFHQKYAYEDFIEGIKPLLQDGEAEVQASDLQFELKRGIFYNSCLEALRLVGYDSFEACYADSEENRIARFDAARNNPAQQFALFVDEINRANISAVLGELITLLEEDKRIGGANEMWVELPYSNEKFSVPANLYVVGTMNTADRSIALLDIALRRRFEFRALYPEYTEGEWWAPLLEALNQAIYNWKKNPDFFIGHAFFMNKPEADKVNILNTKIIPLLMEYCQNNAEAVRRILTEAGVGLKHTTIKENFQIIAG